MSAEPEGLVLQMLRAMRAGIGDMRGTMATKTDVADLKSNISSPRADVASDLIQVRKDLSEQIVGLCRALVECHTALDMAS